MLVGGGHAHVQVLRHLEASRPPPAAVTVLVDRPLAVYSGMVPGFVAGGYEQHELEIDVVSLATLAGARVVLSAVERVDARGRQLHLADGSTLAYDLCSLNIGSTVSGLDLPGVREHALPTRPIGDLVRRVEGLLTAARGRPGGPPFQVLVVGAGAGGVELAFCLQARLHREAATAEVLLLEDRPQILGGYPARLAARVLVQARRRGLGVQTGARVEAVEEGRLRLQRGQELAFDALIWVAGAASPPLLRGSGLPVDQRGFVWIRPTLQVEGHRDLFAVGDCATLRDYPETPKAGVYAVRQGPVLARNLEAAWKGEPLEEYRPQADFLTLLNLGDGRAVGVKKGLTFEGRWVMWLKDRIDRRFMRRFQVGEGRGDP